MMISMKSLLKIFRRLRFAHGAYLSANGFGVTVTRKSSDLVNIKEKDTEPFGKIIFGKAFDLLSPRLI